MGVRGGRCRAASRPTDPGSVMHTAAHKVLGWVCVRGRAEGWVC